MEKFNLLEWHDAILKSIIINRNDAGHNDSIEMTILWASEIESKIIFKDVYFANLSLNFGVIADESILDASIISNMDPELIMVKSKWITYYESINNIYGFEILTASTASKIRIFAMSFVLENL